MARISRALLLSAAVRTVGREPPRLSRHLRLRNDLRIRLHAVRASGQIDRNALRLPGYCDRRDSAADRTSAKSVRLPHERRVAGRVADRQAPAARARVCACRPRIFDKSAPAAVVAGQSAAEVPGRHFLQSLSLPSDRRAPTIGVEFANTYGRSALRPGMASQVHDRRLRRGDRRSSGRHVSVRTSAAAHRTTGSAPGTKRALTGA